MTAHPESAARLLQEASELTQRAAVLTTEARALAAAYTEGYWTGRGERMAEEVRIAEQDRS